MIDWLLLGFCIAFGVLLASAAISTFDILRLWPLNRRNTNV